MFFAKCEESLTAKENRGFLAESRINGSVRFFIFLNTIDLSFQD